jgi:hypothetical protein
MKPEASGSSKEQENGKEQVVNGKEEVVQGELEEVQDPELSEDEKAVLNLLKANSPIDLNALKGQSGLSNKKWDKAIKGLTKNKLAKVEKTEEGLFVSVV